MRHGKQPKSRQCRIPPIELKQELFHGSEMIREQLDMLSSTTYNMSSILSTILRVLSLSHLSYAQAKKDAAEASKAKKAAEDAKVRELCTKQASLLALM